MEHTDDPEVAKSIAKDHLTEISDYYDRLERMESEAKVSLRNELITTYKDYDIIKTKKGSYYMQHVGSDRTKDIDMVTYSIGEAKKVIDEIDAREYGNMSNSKSPRETGSMKNSNFSTPESRREKGRELFSYMKNTNNKYDQFIDKLEPGRWYTVQELVTMAHGYREIIQDLKAAGRLENNGNFEPGLTKYRIKQ